MTLGNFPFMSMNYVLNMITDNLMPDENLGNSVLMQQNRFANVTEINVFSSTVSSQFSFANLAGFSIIFLRAILTDDFSFSFQK